MNELRYCTFALLLVSLGLTCEACQQVESTRDAGPPVAVRWAEARALWHIDRDPSAYAAWRSIPSHTPEGREAATLLQRADPLYRQGIREVRGGDDGARRTLTRAVRMAPMNPDLYLPLARAFRDQGRAHRDNPHLFIRADEYYRKFLALRPHHPEAPRARAELAEIDPDGASPFALPRAPSPVPRGAAAARRESEGSTTEVVALGALAVLLALAALYLLARRGRVRRRTLAQLAQHRPELHPAMTYLIGSLRHELLKHRIGAVGDAVEALRGGRASDDQLSFMWGRLYGGEPLPRAWSGHIVALERALGSELDVMGDPLLREADRAIRGIAAVEDRVRRHERRAVTRLSRACEALRQLDMHLSTLVQGLVRTSVDGALLREVVDEVRSEYAAAQVVLDEVAIRSPEPAPFVEVFRIDLVLVLKNVVRNAILALGSEEPPRRVGLSVETDVALTGEEVVRIHVRDTSAQRFSTSDIYERRMDRGLGLVTAALSRYDAAISVEEAPEGWEKSVVVRFFRAYPEDA